MLYFPVFPSNNGLTDCTLFVRIIPLSCQLQISGSIIYCKHFQPSHQSVAGLDHSWSQIVSHLTVRNYDTVTFSWLSIIILIHLVWILNILGDTALVGERGRTSMSYFLDFCRWETLEIKKNIFSFLIGPPASDLLFLCPTLFLSHHDTIDTYL